MPAKVQAFADGAVLALALAQEFFFKVVAEIEIQLVGGRKLFLADNAGKAARVAYLCITGEQLV